MAAASESERQTRSAQGRRTRDRQAETDRPGTGQAYSPGGERITQAKRPADMASRPASNTRPEGEEQRKSERERERERERAGRERLADAGRQAGVQGGGRGVRGRGSGLERGEGWEGRRRSQRARERRRLGNKAAARQRSGAAEVRIGKERLNDNRLLLAAGSRPSPSLSAVLACPPASVSLLHSSLCLPPSLRLSAYRLGLACLSVYGFS